MTSLLLKLRAGMEDKYVSNTRLGAKTTLENLDRNSRSVLEFASGKDISKLTTDAKGKSGILMRDSYHPLLDAFDAIIKPALTRQMELNECADAFRRAEQVRDASEAIARQIEGRVVIASLRAKLPAIGSPQRIAEAKRKCALSDLRLTDIDTSATELFYQLRTKLHTLGDAASRIEDILNYAQKIPAIVPRLLPIVSNPIPLFIGSLEHTDAVFAASDEISGLPSAERALNPDEFRLKIDFITSALTTIDGEVSALKTEIERTIAAARNLLDRQ